MSKAAKIVNAPPSGGAEMPFEEALKKLESIVEEMDSGDLPLETMLARFEEGMRLSQMCQTKLASAEVRIQQIESTATGETFLKPVEPPDPSAED